MCSSLCKIVKVGDRSARRNCCTLFPFYESIFVSYVVSAICTLRKRSIPLYLMIPLLLSITLFSWIFLNLPFSLPGYVGMLYILLLVISSKWHPTPVNVYPPVCFFIPILFALSMLKHARHCIKLPFTYFVLGISNRNSSFRKASPSPSYFLWP